MARLGHGWQAEALVAWAVDQGLDPSLVVRDTLGVFCGVVYGRKFVRDEDGVRLVKGDKFVTKRFWRIQRTRLPREWKWN